MQSAKKYAFLLLKFRLRSEKEIYQRLKKKRFDEKTIQETLAFLKEGRFIDDAAFARAWIESRLKRPLGLTVIKKELQLKGVSGDIINKQVEELKDNYSEDEIVTRVAKERLNKLKGLEPCDARRRIYSYLLRRGYSLQAVCDALEQLFLK